MFRGQWDFSVAPTMATFRALNILAADLAMVCLPEALLLVDLIIGKGACGVKCASDARNPCTGGALTPWQKWRRYRSRIQLAG